MARPLLVALFHMRPFLVFSSALAMSVAAASLCPRPAAACGGCFAPPSDNTVVTDHRMILSISSKETTLYDQIRYAGNPSSFAWVLPIRGLAKVGISADLVFQVIDQNTRTSILAPPKNCPAPPVCSYRSSGAMDGGATRDSSAVSFVNADASAGGGVTVVKEETVGPYETVQLAATDPNALNAWLSGHGYAIPADVTPMLAGYVKEGFGFLALKLVPGSGVQSMKPVRVTTEGALPSLPLRMVAAGSGVGVGVTLWVVGDGRWEPRSFPSFTVKASDLSWTWQTSTHDYQAVREASVARLGGAAWEVESSIAFGASLVTSTIDRSVNNTMPPQVQLPDGGFGPFSLYDPVAASDAGPAQTSEQVADADMLALFQRNTAPIVTRMRSDLPRASLATDLDLQASADQSTLPNIRQITREADEPLCANYDGCTLTGQVPRSQARANAIASCGGKGTGKEFCPQLGNTDDPNASGGSSDCSVHASVAHDGAAPVGLAAVFALTAIARFARRRRSIHR